MFTFSFLLSGETTVLLGPVQLGNVDPISIFGSSISTDKTGVSAIVVDLGYDFVFDLVVDKCLTILQVFSK